MLSSVWLNLPHSNVLRAEHHPWKKCDLYSLSSYFILFKNRGPALNYDWSMTAYEGKYNKPGSACNMCPYSISLKHWLKSNPCRFWIDFSRMHFFFRRKVSKFSDAIFFHPIRTFFVTNREAAPAANTFRSPPAIHRFHRSQTLQAQRLRPGVGAPHCGSFHQDSFAGCNVSGRDHDVADPGAAIDVERPAGPWLASAVLSFLGLGVRNAKVD